MKQIKVSEATELQLDWLVAKCESMKLHRNALLDGQVKEGWWVSGYYIDPNNWIPLSLLNFSTDWAQGGPIKEREKIGTNWVVSNYLNIDGCWSAHIPQSNGRLLYAQTELVAAMRCYVINKLGETAEVPDELVCPNT